jgi:hypothetical protein
VDFGGFKRGGQHAISDNLHYSTDGDQAMIGFVWLYLSRHLPDLPDDLAVAVEYWLLRLMLPTWLLGTLACVIWFLVELL